MAGQGGAAAAEDPHPHEALGPDGRASRSDPGNDQPAAAGTAGEKNGPCPWLDKQERTTVQYS